MRGSRTTAFSLGLFACALSSSAAVWAARAQTAANWRAADAAVTVNCPLTVGGSFDATTASLEGELTADSSKPQALNGELSVDLSTLDTGIELRNTHLRERYLEIGKGPGFAKATLTSIVLERAASGFNGSTRFTATLTVHGVTKPVAGEVKLQPGSTSTRVQATFRVHLPDHGIPKPRYLGVGVKDDVQVRVTFNAIHTTK
jgi:polyisoprenoid-binding protein YceI